ncbi:hypothetical protein PhaeoP18_02348 [Phaeobacter piscinae]|uniref:Uncharacterized protein n=1 Tax=Phaeobacter piscinae TaxID=1580596 RepID=A0AAN1LB56_9RHOB|nr:hypothetical protein PhaeoP13_02369 [Phaeobacter piscinae]AUR36597.1 hypothetical protein PhaeoP18_02348 [Phaeobacter piscinae]
MSKRPAILMRAVFFSAHPSGPNGTKKLRPQILRTQLPFPLAVAKAQNFDVSVRAMFRPSPK